MRCVPSLLASALLATLAASSALADGCYIPVPAGARVDRAMQRAVSPDTYRVVLEFA